MMSLASVPHSYGCCCSSRWGMITLWADKGQIHGHVGGFGFYLHMHDWWRHDTSLACWEVRPRLDPRMICGAASRGGCGAEGHLNDSLPPMSWTQHRGWCGRCMRRQWRPQAQDLGGLGGSVWRSDQASPMRLDPIASVLLCSMARPTFYTLGAAMAMWHSTLFVLFGPDMITRAFTQMCLNSVFFIMVPGRVANAKQFYIPFNISQSFCRHGSRKTVIGVRIDRQPWLMQVFRFNINSCGIIFSILVKPTPSVPKSLSFALSKK